MSDSKKRATPETDRIFRNWVKTHGILDTARLHAESLENHRDELEDLIEKAVDILDGNEPVIDWRDGNEPELLRKLCEFLEAKAGMYHKPNQ